MPRSTPAVANVGGGTPSDRHGAPHRASAEHGARKLQPKNEYNEGAWGSSSSNCGGPQHTAVASALGRRASQSLPYPAPARANAYLGSCLGHSTVRNTRIGQSDSAEGGCERRARCSRSRVDAMHARLRGVRWHRHGACAAAAAQTTHSGFICRSRILARRHCCRQAALQRLDALHAAVSRSQRQHRRAVRAGDHGAAPALRRQGRRFVSARQQPGSRVR